MAEEAKKPNYLMYGAVLAVVLYVGGIMPAQDEQALLEAAVVEQEAASAGRAEVLRRAKDASAAFEKRRAQLGRLLGSAVPSLGSTAPMGPVSATEIFSAVTSVAVAAGLPLAELRPTSPLASAAFAGEGCAFTVSSSDERQLFRFLRSLQAHPTRPRFRTLALERRAGETGQGPRVEASVTLSFTRALPAGQSAAAGLKLTSPALPDEADLEGWALFFARPKARVAARRPGPGATTGGASSGAGPTDVATGAVTVEDGPKAEASAAPKPLPPGPPPSLAGVELLGTISLDGLDGIITTVGGTQKLVFVGDEVGGYTLASVEPSRAVFRRGEATAEVLMKRESFFPTAPTSGVPPPPPARPPAAAKLGVQGRLVDCEFEEGYAELSRDGFGHAMVVTAVEPGSLAESMRLAVDDAIFAIDGERVRTATQLRLAADRAAQGTGLKFDVLRRGVRTSLSSGR